SKMVSRAIRSAQTQIEQQNFEIRKNVLKYDEVLNKQRTVIYDERRQILHGDDLHVQIANMVTDAVTGYVDAATADGYPEDWDLEQLWTALKTLYPITLSVEDVAADRHDLDRDLLVETLTENAAVAYAAREESLGSEVMRELERRVLLSVLDRKWREHLYEMDYMQEGIGLRAMGQRDPLVEYQREAFTMFQVMLEAIKEESVGFLFNLEVEVNAFDPEAPTGADEVGPDGQIEITQGELRPLMPEEVEAEGVEPSPVASEAPMTVEAIDQEAPAAGTAGSRRPLRTVADVLPKELSSARRAINLSYSAPTMDGDGGVARSTGAGPMSSLAAGDKGNNPGQAVGADPSRNGPCPCGSGRKYKRCHGDPRNNNAV
ncbi:MAG: preprotein translocase subunit SecA, partial [Frankiales bacterium]|nr:preprotein translocase subunit SecA [Frankiales bacterium]